MGCGRPITDLADATYALLDADDFGTIDPLHKSAACLCLYRTSPAGRRAEREELVPDVEALGYDGESLADLVADAVRAAAKYPGATLEKTEV